MRDSNMFHLFNIATIVKMRSIPSSYVYGLWLVVWLHDNCVIHPFEALSVVPNLESNEI